jgi:hypothetical protein
MELKWNGLGRYTDLVRAGWSRDRIPAGGGEIIRTRPDRPWGLLSLLYNVCRVSFPGVNQPERGVSHPPQSNAEVKEREKLYFYTPLGLFWGELYSYLY